MSGSSDSSAVIEADGLMSDVEQEIRIARRCFNQVERVTTLMATYPAGHPTVTASVEVLKEAFDELFELTDRLTVQIFPHWMNFYGTDETVWETEDPKDYCFALSRDGIYMLHILAGIDKDELQRFVQVLNALVDQRNFDDDAATLLFDGGFRFISWDAVDESLAQLAGLDTDLRNRDTKEEQEMIEELFQKAVDEKLEKEVGGESAVEQDFQLRMERRSQRHMKLNVGAREFLALSPEAQEHLGELRKHFTEHRELEHRQGEVLSALLGSRPRRKLRKRAITQIGNVMGSLLETDAPWEALSFLKLIHQWRDRFQPEVAGELKEEVQECFTPERIEALLQKVAYGSKESRRAILQMFNALQLSEASTAMVDLLVWEIEEEARQDIGRYLKAQVQRGVGFIEAGLSELTAGAANELVEILLEALPRSRPTLIAVLKRAEDPVVKVRALRALHGSWSDPVEVRDVVVPLVGADDSELRVAAVQTLAEAAPQHIYRVIEPIFTPRLASRPEREVGEFVRLFVEVGGTQALEKLRELVQRRGLVGEDEQELAVTIVKALIKAPTEEIIELLDTVSRDWLVAGRIRSTCKEIVDLLSRG